MRLLEAAGLPPGVINMLPGDGIEVSEVALVHPDFAGIHFTGSTKTFQHLWQTCRSQHRPLSDISTAGGGDRRQRLRGRPRQRRSRRAAYGTSPRRLRVLGGKCSAASRAYIARSLWDRMGDELVDATESLKLGDVRDLSNFTSAVIDQRAFTKHSPRRSNGPGLCGRQDHRRRSDR